LNDFEVGLKLHSKKSLYSTHGDFWRKRIVNELLKNPTKTNQICHVLRELNVGIVGGDQEFIQAMEFWGSNFDSSKKLVEKIYQDSIGVSDLGFFAGSMFWFRPDVFKDLLQFDSSDLDFGVEEGKLDGTLAHVFERVLCIFVEKAGYTLAGVNDPEQEIRFLNLNNRTPVN
jgi:rhamnosyltransferase